MKSLLEESDFTIKSEDQEFIAKFVDIMGGLHISGINPFDYLESE